MQKTDDLPLSVSVGPAYISFTDTKYPEIQLNFGPWYRRAWFLLKAFWALTFTGKLYK